MVISSPEPSDPVEQEVAKLTADLDRVLDTEGGLAEILAKHPNPLSARDAAVVALMAAVYAVHPHLPQGDAPAARLVRTSSAALIDAGLGLSGQAYTVLRVGNAADAHRLAAAVTYIMEPDPAKREVTPEDLQVAELVIKLLVTRAI